MLSYSHQDQPPTRMKLTTRVIILKSNVRCLTVSSTKYCQQICQFDSKQLLYFTLFIN